MREPRPGDQYHTACLALAPRTSAVLVAARRLMCRRLTVVAVVVLTSTACAYKGLSMAAQSAVTLHGDGALTEPNATSTAETYNPAFAPVGSRLKVTFNPSDESTNA
jgi:hypothetical protein